MSAIKTPVALTCHTTWWCFTHKGPAYLQTKQKTKSWGPAQWVHRARPASAPFQWRKTDPEKTNKDSSRVQ